MTNTPTRLGKMMRHLQEHAAQRTEPNNSPYAIYVIVCSSHSDDDNVNRVIGWWDTEHKAITFLSLHQPDDEDWAVYQILHYENFRRDRDDIPF
jgi:hypothetical protein